MISKSNLSILLILLSLHVSFAQGNGHATGDTDASHRYRVSFPVITLLNIGAGGSRTNTQHVELHVRYEVDDQNIVGVKFATWRLFQPMGILWWDGLLDKIESQSEFYPGYLRETGLGISYQRMLWRGLFATVEVLPQIKTYTDLQGSPAGRGFKLYTSYHIGYHIPLFKNRLFIEPQIHCQNWMIDTQSPPGFHALDQTWRDYFLFEPNIYLGVKL